MNLVSIEPKTTIRAVRYIPGIDPHQVEIGNTLADLQGAVGGDIEAVTLKNGLVLLCDEAGKTKHRIKNGDATTLLRRDCPGTKDYIVGVTLLVGAGDGGAFTDWDNGGMPPFVLDGGD